MAKPKAERDGSLPKELRDVRAKFGDRLTNLANSASQRIAEEAPAISASVEVATQVMELREFAGRRNLILQSWFGGQPVPASQIIEVERLTGHINASWQNASRMADGIAGAQGLHEEKARQQETYERQDEVHWQRLSLAAWERMAGGAGGSGAVLCSNRH